MSFMDVISKAAEATDLDDKLLSKAGIKGIDEKKIAEIKKLIGKVDFDKVDIDGIAKKAGVPSDVVKTVLKMIK